MATKHTVVDDTQTPAKKQEKTKQPIKLRTFEPREYDTDLINNFLDVVFSDVDDKEKILAWKVYPGRHPAFPISDEDLLGILPRTHKAAALYFGTSTCSPDPKDGRLYNRKSLFKRLHVVVLDDIGTKVPLKKLPENFKPTYIVETSEGNYQYGYVLSEPVDELAAADTLIQLVYESGLSDEGGKMPTKLVRLPEGINAKPGKNGFVTRLLHMAGPTYTPQQILSALDVDVAWEDVLADAEQVAKSRAHLKVGTSPWSPITATASALNGTIDPVLEWLYENDQVVQDTGEWVTVQCPWHDTHTDGEKTAGYMPVGRGDKTDLRAFNCFHEHCKTRRSTEYLAWIAANGGPEASVHDHAAHLTGSWVYDAHNDAAWRIKDITHPIQISMTAFGNLHPNSTNIVGHDGKVKTVKETALWLRAPARVTVYGQTFNPSTSARIVEADGLNYINMFSPPAWSISTPEAEHVKKFKQFLEYLIPAEKEREYFLDWLGAKVQDMGFRGPAILMIARQQGTGRTTLTDMLATMFGVHNVQNVPFSEIVGDSVHNEWLVAPLVTSDETLNTGNTNFYHTYEKLKDYIDPRPKRARINPKYGKKYITNVHSSFIFLSNHSDAVVLGAFDRRFYVISNAHTPESPAYFTQINRWLNKKNEAGEPAWAGSVWRWLSARKVDLGPLLAPPEMTHAKRTMIAETSSPIETTVNALLDCWTTEYATIAEIQKAVEHFATRISLYETKGWQQLIKRLITTRTTAYAQNVTVKVHNKVSRPRVITARINAETVNPVLNTHPEKAARAHIADNIRRTNMEEILKEVSDILDLSDL